MDRQSVKASTLKTDPTQQQRKKVLIVVGRMGAGKSAFVNTLIIPRQGCIIQDIKNDLVQEGDGLTSVTDQCLLRKVNGSHQLLANQQQKLYVIDTPGLDSESVPSLISENIDNMIIQHNCDIVAIIYLVNLSQRQIGANSQSKIKQFLKVLKIKKDLKNELVFFVLSKWDEICTKKNHQVLQDQFNKLITSFGIPDPQKKTIKWTNQRSIDDLEYFKLKKNGFQILETQWKKLKENIRRCEFIPFTLEDHLENIKNFWQNLKDRVLSQIDNQNIKYEKDPTPIYYDLKIKLREWDILKDEGNVIEVLLKIPVLNIIFLFYSIGSWAKNKNSKLAEGLEENQKMKSAQKIMELVGHIRTKIKSIIILSLLKSIQVQENKLIINKVAKILKINKLYLFYESQFVQSLHKDQKLKVPIAFIYNERLKERVQIKFSFQYDGERAVQYEEQVVQNFKGQNEKSLRVLVPQKTKFFVKQNQEFFTLKLKTVCRLPEESSLCGLVKDLCVEMFGDYK